MSQQDGGHYVAPPLSRKQQKKLAKPPPTQTEIILDTLTQYKKKKPLGPPSGFWNYIFVRCTYTDDERWAAFFTKVQQQNTVEDPVLRQYQAWTAFEDKEKLDGVSMFQASQYFQERTKSLVVEEQSTPRNPRYLFYIYVNEESIESIVDPLRAKERTGNFLILVHLESNLDDSGLGHSYQEPDIDDQIADDGDISYKLISTNSILVYYLEYIEDPNIWFNLIDVGYGPPFIHGRHSDTLQIKRIVDNPDPIGMNVYHMLKQIYGKGHYRSKFFEADEAQTRRQSFRGYNGGWFLKEFQAGF